MTAVENTRPTMPSTWEARLARLLPWVAVALYPVLLARGWGRWNDVLVDFGRELYVPWRLVEGDVLYRDVAYFNGPLSPYVNALWFELGGTGLTTLLVANAVITALFGTLLYLVLRRVGGALGAGFALLSFLPVFACGQFAGIGNYNFLSPYSHELTHGLLLGLAAFYAVLGWRPNRRSRRLELAGLLLGLAFLTKPEVFAAAAAGVVVTVLGSLHAVRVKPRDWPPHLARLVLPAAIAPLVAGGLLAMAMPLHEAFAATLGGWRGIFDSAVVELPYYQRMLGFDQPMTNAQLGLESFGWLALVLAPAALVDWLLRGRPRALGCVAGAVAFAVVFATLAAQAPDLAGLRAPRGAVPAMRQALVYWMGYSRHLPLSGLLAAVTASWIAFSGRDEDTRLRWFGCAGFAVFATLLLAKMVLNVMFAQYGFALAVLGALLVVVVVLEWIPAALATGGCSGWVVRGAAIGALAAGAGFSWQVSEATFASKTVPIADGADRFYAGQLRGFAVEKTLAAIDARFGPKDSVLVLPEGIMINYLARRRAPTRYINFMPPEVFLFGEEAILAALQADPPAGVILVHKDTSEYGFPLFGRDYGRAIMRWTREHYRDVTPIFGGPPLRPGTRFGVALLE